MEIQLTIWQRAMLVSIIQGLRGDVKMLRLAIRALDELEFTDPEREEAGIVEEGGRMQWDAEAGATVYTVALEKPVLRFVRNAAEGFGGWPVGQADEALDLLEKLAGTTDGTTDRTTDKEIHDRTTDGEIHDHDGEGAE